MNHRAAPFRYSAAPSLRVTSAVLLLALITAACEKKPATAADSSAARADSVIASTASDTSTKTQLALPVVAENARDGDLVLRVTTTGQVRSDAAVKLRAEVSGTIAKLLVRPGTRVARGQVLVTLDPYPFDLAVREAQATSDEAEQRYLESYVPESLVTGRGPTPEQRKALINKSGLSGAKLRLERAKFEQSHAIPLEPIYTGKMMYGIFDLLEKGFFGGFVF